MRVENPVLVAPVDVEEALWRLQSAADALELVRSLKGTGALSCADGEVLVDLTELTGDSVGLVVPKITIFERGDDLR